MIDEMLPRFEKDEGSSYGEGELFEDIDLDFFVKRSGDDIIENGNNVSDVLDMFGTVYWCGCGCVHGSVPRAVLCSFAVCERRCSCVRKSPASRTPLVSRWMVDPRSHHGEISLIRDCEKRDNLYV